MEARSSGGDEGDGASRRLQRALLDRNRARTWWGASGCGEPRTQRPGLHLSLYSAARWGPPTIIGLGAPDQGVDQRLKLVVGPTWWRST